MQVAYNFGNAMGSVVGGAALTATAMNYHSIGLAGTPFTAAAGILLAVYSYKYERRRSALERLEKIEV